MHVQAQLVSIFNVFHLSVLFVEFIIIELTFFCSYKRPSQWLHLDRSQLGLLAQSIRSIKLGGGLADRDH